MKTTLLLIATVALATPSLSADWTDLTVKWNVTDILHLDSWYGIPITQSAAGIENWVELPERTLYPGTTAYCIEDDHHFCTLFDGYGNIAGFQWALTKVEVTRVQASYNMSAIDMYEEKTLFGKPCWTVTILTVSPDTIAAGGRSNAGNVLGSAGIWIVTKNGYVTIPKNIEDLDPIWKKGICIPAMGTHYYYGMSPTMACENYRPVVVMYNNGTLSATAFQTFGETIPIERQWQEQFSYTVIRSLIPMAPQCLVDLAEKHGVISMHAFFENQPWNLKC